MHFAFVNYLLTLCLSEETGGMWSRNIGDSYVGNSKNPILLASSGRRCGTSKSDQVKCAIDRYIFTRMQEMSLFCCENYWKDWIATKDPNTGANNCKTLQLAYWLWVPGKLANGLNIQNLNQYYKDLKEHLDYFDPSHHDDAVRAKMCNCGHNKFKNKDKKICTHEEQPDGVNPASEDYDVTTDNDKWYPYMSWVTLHSNTYIYTRYHSRFLIA